MLLVTAAALSAQEAIPWGQEFRVNTTVEGYQSSASIAGLSDGGFVVCWMSADQNYYQNGTFAQRYGSDGKAVGEEFRIISEADGYQSTLCSTGLSNRRFVVCFQLIQVGYPDIFAKCYGADGKPLNDKFRVNNVTENNQYSPAIASLANGDFVVSWSSDQNHTGNIFARRYRAEGEPLGDEFCVNSTPAYYFADPSVTGLSDGGFVVCGGSYEEGYGAGIHARRFGADGKPLGSEFRVNSNRELHQEASHVIALTNGGFVICWETSGKDGSNHRMWALCYGADGQPVGDEFCVSTHKEDWESMLHVSGLSNGGFVACWASWDLASPGSRIYAQRFQANGNRVGGEFRVKSYSKYYNECPYVAGLSGGGFVVCWQSNQEGFEWGIYGKRFPPEPLRHALRPFLLKQPAYDATVQTMTPLLQWQAASRQPIAYPEELVYTVYFDTLSDLSTAGQTATTPDTTTTLPALKKGKTWFWKVLAKTCYGDSLWSDVSAFFVSHNPTGVQAMASVPCRYAVLCNYPNPFNSSTTIRFELPVNGYVTMNIYDLTGRLVRVLARGGETGGMHTVIWDGTNEAGEWVAAGLYFCRLEFEDSAGEQQVLMQKMSLVK